MCTHQPLHESKVTSAWQQIRYNRTTQQEQAWVRVLGSTLLPSILTDGSSAGRATTQIQISLHRCIQQNFRATPDRIQLHNRPFQTQTHFQECNYNMQMGNIYHCSRQRCNYKLYTFIGMRTPLCN